MPEQRRLSGHGQPLTDGAERESRSPGRKPGDTVCMPRARPTITADAPPPSDAPGLATPAEARGAVFTQNTTSCRFCLAGIRRLVLRFASCEAVLDEPGIGGSSRSIRIFRPSGECAAAKRDGEKANATRLLPSPAVIDYQRTLPDPHPRAWFSTAKNRCQSDKTQGRIPREDRNFRLSGPDR